MLHIALPVMNEPELLPVLMDCVRSQTFRDFQFYVCINQPDEWWDDPGKIQACENNRKSLEYLKRLDDPRIVIIDKCSRGTGWSGRKHGVGWARKTVMDLINRHGADKDILISLDADTTFSPNYFMSVVENFAEHPEAVALAVPYFHHQVSDSRAYRAILRYEIYMRYYSINMWRTGSPYTFTALGSAIACPLWAYRAVGGMTPKMSGEDFYFLQKLRKYGMMLFHNKEKVYPAARFSDRVYFGTGPAMIKGDAGDWSSYPIYPFRFFDEIAETIRIFPDFFTSTQSTRVSEFLKTQFNESDPFRPLRENCRDRQQFIRACHEKLDGLRILQYLKMRIKEESSADEKNLGDFLISFYPDEIPAMNIDFGKLSFMNSGLDILEDIRMFLVKKEEEIQAMTAPSLPGQQLPST